jgi:putative transcriptional regulator
MKEYKSEALMVNHQTAEGLYRIGAIDDAKMREYDEDCLVPDTEKNGKSCYVLENEHAIAV